MSLLRRMIMTNQGSSTPPEPVLPYDAQIQYIQTDGYAYIDTNYNPKQNTRFSLTFYNPADYSKAIWFFGTRNSLSAGQMACIVDYVNDNISWRYGNKSPKTSGALTSGTYTFSNLTTASILTVGNVSITATANTFTSNYPLLIFTLNVSGTPTINSIGEGIRFLEGKIYNNTTLVRDYIPVRVGQVGYLYDKVSGTLFGNANENGAFVLGPDVNN